MNNIFNINNVVNEKYLYKSILRSSKFRNCILDINTLQFDFKNLNHKKKLKKLFFNRNVFTYFKHKKKDLKFIFLKKFNKYKQIKSDSILNKFRYLKTKCLITKPIRKGFRVFSHKYKGFIKRKNLSIVLKKFKIQLLKNSENLTNSIYLANLHELKNFIFHKLLFTREIEKYNDFKIFTKKNYKKRKKIIKLKLKNKIVLKLAKKFEINKKYGKKTKIKKGSKKNYNKENYKKNNYSKYAKKGLSIEQKQLFT